jgi:quercetin dioxygenase-like cupin family protein
MKQIQERLSTYIDRLERLGGRFGNDGVMLSTSITEREVLVDGDDDRISKDPVLYPLFKHNMFYLVTVPAGTVVSPHAHDEDIFRLIVKGSLTLNKRYRIEAGTWFAVKAGSKYEITTDEGYLSLAGYTSNCRTRRMESGLHGVKKVKTQVAAKPAKATKKK